MEGSEQWVPQENLMLRFFRAFRKFHAGYRWPQFVTTVVDDADNSLECAVSQEGGRCWSFYSFLDGLEPWVGA